MAESFSGFRVLSMALTFVIVITLWFFVVLLVSAAIIAGSLSIIWLVAWMPFIFILRLRKSRMQWFCWSLIYLRVSFILIITGHQTVMILIGHIRNMRYIRHIWDITCMRHIGYSSHMVVHILHIAGMILRIMMSISDIMVIRLSVLIVIISSLVLLIIIIVVHLEISLHVVMGRGAFFLLWTILIWQLWSGFIWDGIGRYCGGIVVTGMMRWMVIGWWLIVVSVLVVWGLIRFGMVTVVVVHNNIFIIAIMALCIWSHYFLYIWVYSIDWIYEVRWWTNISDQWLM